MRRNSGGCLAVWTAIQLLCLAFLLAMVWQQKSFQARLDEYNTVAVINGPPLTASRTKLKATLLEAREARRPTGDKGAMSRYGIVTLKLPVRLPYTPLRNEGQSFAHLDAEQIIRFHPPQEVTVEVYEGYIISIDTGSDVVLT